MFDLKDPAAVMYGSPSAARSTGPGLHPALRVRLPAGWESLRLSFITDRPERSPLALERHGWAAAPSRYTTRAYAADRPVGSRY